MVQAVPVALREGPYRFFFYSGERDEPRHVHVMRDDRVAKFWLDPVRMERSGGLRGYEIRQVQRIIERNQRALLEAWDAFFND